jgi:ACT domain-containing protein
MITMADLSKITISFTELQQQLEALGEEMGLSIRIQREEIFTAMHRI